MQSSGFNSDSLQQGRDVCVASILPLDVPDLQAACILVPQLASPCALVCHWAIKT